jgi:opacity protein-like surface antigen
MKKNLGSILPGMLLIAGITPPLQAGNWYVGGGLQGVSFEDDFDEIDSGAGITFSGGYHSDELISAELLAGSSYHEDAFRDEDVDQFSIMGGAKISFGDESFKPFVSAGISLNVVDIDHYDDITGAGFYWGVGADIFVAEQHAINVGYRSNKWDGESDDDDIDFDVETNTLTVAYTFHFLN